MANRYTVKQLADLSGVTIRTLHYYDQIGLLKPAQRSEKHYRNYSRVELLRLQQILIYRELDFPLEQIGAILDDPSFDFFQALREQRRTLFHKQEYLGRLIHSLDQTLAQLDGEQEMTLVDKDLYQGFDQKKIDHWNKESEEIYGPEKVAESRWNMGKMSRDQFSKVKEQGETVTWAIAENMQHAADSAVDQSSSRLDREFLLFVIVTCIRILGDVMKKIWNSPLIMRSSNQVWPCSCVML